jgi:hypothetical protein
MAKKKVQFEITAVDKTAATFKKVARGFAGLSRTALNLTAGVGKVGLGMAALGTGAAIGGLMAVKRVMSEAIDLANEQEAAENRLAATLKATGGAAGYNLDELKKMASAMQEVTTVGDETTLAGMSILATFKNIKGEAFQGATMAALDMSHVMGQDLNSSMVQLGKALNDPVKGLSALSRVGVTFTEEQKEMIARLQESGDMMGAQKVILEELKSEFGGAASEATQTFSGKVQQMKNAWGDLLEELGFVITKNKRFSELAGQIKDKINEWIEKLAAWREANKELVAQKFDEWVAKIRGWIVKAYNAITEIASKVEIWYRMNQKVVDSGFVDFLIGLKTIAVTVWTVFQKVGKIIGFVAAKIAGFIDKIKELDAVKATIELFGKASPVRPLTETIENVQGKFSNMASQINSAKIGTTVGFGSDMSSAIFSRLMELNQQSAFATAAAQTQTYGAANIARGGAASAKKQMEIEKEGMLEIMKMFGGAMGGGAGTTGGGVVVNIENAFGAIGDQVADQIAAALQNRGYDIGHMRTA